MFEAIWGGEAEVAPPRSSTVESVRWPPAGAQRVEPEVMAPPRVSEPEPPRISQPEPPPFTPPEAPPVAPSRPAVSSRPLPPRPLVPPEPEVGIFKSGVIDGMAYTLYTDGSIEAELAHGTVKFASIEELRAYLVARGS